MAANPYLGQLSPAIGGGLGGLPRRSASAAAAAVTGAYALGTPLSSFSVSNGSGYDVGNAIAPITSTSCMAINTYSATLSYQVASAALNSDGIGNTTWSAATSGTLPSFGSGAYAKKICLLGSSKVLFGYCSSTASSVQFSLFTKSGSTYVQTSSSIPLFIATGNWGVSGLIALNDLQAIALINNHTTGSLYLVVVDISTGSVAFGLPVPVANSGIAYFDQLIDLGGSRFLIFTTNNSSGCYGRIFSVTGTTPSPGSETVLLSGTPGAKCFNTERGPIAVALFGGNIRAYTIDCSGAVPILTQIYQGTTTSPAGLTNMLSTVNYQFSMTKAGSSAAFGVFPFTGYGLAGVLLQFNAAGMLLISMQYIGYLPFDPMYADGYTTVNYPAVAYKDGNLFMAWTQVRPADQYAYTKVAIIPVLSI